MYTIPEHIKKQAKEIIAQYTPENQPLGFWMFDIQGVLNAFERWQKAMPSVRPCFAIKCNPEPHFVKLLGDLGCGFDCASINEIKEVLQLGFKAEDITFSQSFKPFNQLIEAYKLGIRHTIVDSVEEIEKIGKYAPEMGVMIRIKENDTSAGHVFGDKFGIDDEEIDMILDVIKKNNVILQGIHFHVGSDSQNSQVFAAALKKAKIVFDNAVKLGMKPYLIDVGGGFSQVSPFEQFAETIEKTIKELNFPDYCHFVSEPGRYFASNSFHFVTSIHGKRVRTVNGKKKVEYVIGDGLHGNFGCCLWFERTKKCVSLTKEVTNENEMYETIVHGPSCNGSDYVSKQLLPMLNQGEDWLFFPNMGAYTLSMATNFNGFEMKGHEMYTIPSETIKEVKVEIFGKRSDIPSFQ